MWIMVSGPYTSGADDEVALFRARGLPVYSRIEDVPDA